jgi:hypothetical protein
LSGNGSSPAVLRADINRIRGMPSAARRTCRAFLRECCVPPENRLKLSVSRAVFPGNDNSSLPNAPLLPPVPRHTGSH